MKFEIIEKRLKNIDSIPTLSAIASELLEMISGNNFSLKKVSDLIKLDQSITVKILKIANSAYYGLRKNIDTLRMALVVLGTSEITDIILSLSLIKSFSDNSKSDFDRTYFWKHSAIVAHLSKLLVEELKITTHGEEFTAGLLHDIGKLILDQYFHEEFSEFLEEKKFKDKSLPDIDLEKQIIGFTHMDVGSWLGKKWKIPFNLLESILYHHEPEKSVYSPQLVAIISLADYFANHYEESEIDYKNTKSWKILSEENEVNLDSFIDNLDEEIEKALAFFEMI